MRKLGSAVIAVGITFLFLMNVSAPDEKSIGLSRENETCMEKSEGVTSKMMDCIGKKQRVRIQGYRYPSFAYNFL